jgi:hypothetical protein
MGKTWRWQLAVDSAALELSACDLSTRGEALTELEIDLLARSKVDAAEFVDGLKMRLSEIDAIGSAGVWWHKLG